MRIIISIILFLNIIYADNFIVANKSCKASNNLKATKNSGNISVVPTQRYRILDEKQTRIYVQIPYASPSGRWVDKSCFYSYKIPQKSNVNNSIIVSRKLPPQFLLSLSWHDAFCETHKNKKECRQSLFENKEHGFVLHGLWPQPENRVYCGLDKKFVGMDKNKQWIRLPDIKLSQKTRHELSIVMPAIVSNLEKHEWIKHGTCSNLSQEEYFTRAASYTKQFNSSILADFINSNRGKSVKLKDIKSLADRSFGIGSGDKIEMVCNDGLMTEIRLSLGSGDMSLANSIKNGEKIRPSCQNGIIDKADWL
ncbi:MAG: hypothetical protein PHE73_03925 [Sulfurovaceae bacterium]|nr:hypothetical protein [Sulfurovaceae bacterium]